jgi:hypothetical protein
MAIRIVEYETQHQDAVAAFNRRMAEGGSRWGFFTDARPDWIPRLPGQSVWREYHVAVDDEDGAVRGAFALKPQPWWVRGQVHTVTDWQGPFSEGSIDARLSTLGLRMLRDMLKKYPLLYSWGHGGDDQPVVQMLLKMGWVMHHTPFCLRVLKPYRFLRLNSLLRSSPARRAVLDLAAFTGAGSVGLPLLHAATRLRHGGGRFSATATLVGEFGPWADALWERCRDRYAAIAQRDAASMNALAPAVGWPPVLRLKVDRGGQTIGWALVMDTRHARTTPRFGEPARRLGRRLPRRTPTDAADVVARGHGASSKARGVDLIASNQAHPGLGRRLPDATAMHDPARTSACSRPRRPCARCWHPSTTPRAACT